VEAVVHRKARRTNIPTAELGSFIKEEEGPSRTVSYPRDPSLDPQLVWKGKEEQDSHDLEVPAVPIYIQEKISPQAIIENLRTEQRKNDDQPSLFSDFDGLDFEQVVQFYQHTQSWTNRLILGDSLFVMASLGEKEGLAGKVQMIYIDPPYGIKFGSNWQVSTHRRDLTDGRGEDLVRQPEQIKAFRDTWQLGIHSYLAYIRDRLSSARTLLTDSGSIFVQIGSQNMHLVHCILDEVFGSDNNVAIINYTKTSAQTARYLPVTTDYILWYAKQIEGLKFRPLYLEKALGGPGSSMYQYVEDRSGKRRRLTTQEQINPTSLPQGSRPFRLGDVTSQRQGRPSGPGSAMYFPVEVHGREFLPPKERGWSTTSVGVQRLKWAGRLAVQGDRLAYVRYLDDFDAFALDNNWSDAAGASDRIYVVQTNTQVVARCILMTTDPSDLVLDPTCGSGTTAYAAEQWGRRWITIDTSRVALALAKTRLMSARLPFYTLADSDAGARVMAERSGSPPQAALSAPQNDVSKGFLYKRVPHVTLKSIASNPDIHDGMSREEVHQAIARHAESETLYDQPVIDPSIVRTTGPFTVESLSPHRALEPAPSSGVDGRQGSSFEATIIDNLKTAGIQNTIKNERLVFTTLEPWPGTYVQALGEYSEGGVTKRAAVCIGPEHGTVGGDLVREAAKEAAKFFDLLVVCGFAFEARVGEEASRLGRLTVLKAAMNPDLAMGPDLLKKTGSANLFTVFGEPDIEIRPASEDKIQVEIKGLDVYDPTTGEIRSHSTNDIACWFIDTDYNDESFFVRHAYFLGAGDPYEQLRRALKAEINEEVWATLHSTVSRPFTKPTTGKIAVKVINHYGDEVLKVYGVK
jgi:adenine-specific DNA-methyltransferase